MRTSPLKEATKSWIWVALFSIIIFLTVPIARNIQSFVAKHLGKDFFIYFVSGVIILIFIIIIYFLATKLRVGFISSYLWLIIITCLYLYFTLKLQKNPPEALHFLEYGILSFLLFRALKHDIKDKSIYVTATLFCLLIGTLDEILQWTLPRRFWDFQDVGLNALSGGLFQFAIWKVIRPKFISTKFNVKSLRFFSYTFAVCLIILGLCISNTPQRVTSYIKSFPWLSFLKDEEPMSEFGYKHTNPSIGIFYSRFSLDRLRETDSQKGKEYAQLLNNSKRTNYEQFIRKYNPTTHPFLHELRVHVFRRDSYLKSAKTASKIDAKKESYFIAYKENLILEKYFGNTIRKSVYAWDENQIKEIEASIDKNRLYESPVSANLFTSFSEKTVWITICSTISLLVFLNIILYFKEKKRKTDSYYQNNIP